MTMLLLLAGCAAQPPPAPAEPARRSVPASEGATPTDATSPTLLGEVQGIAIVGDWTSGACGGRTYARNISFASDQHYAAVDLVSPCPPDVACVWSGITAFAGLWELQGKKLRVQEVGVPATPGGPRPVFFEATADGKLVENGCLYEKGLTVPPGYEEATVRPAVGQKRLTPPTGTEPAAVLVPTPPV
jgi:hypothetical protein